MIINNPILKENQEVTTVMIEITIKIINIEEREVIQKIKSIEEDREVILMKEDIRKERDLLLPEVKNREEETINISIESMIQKIEEESEIINTKIYFISL